MRNYASTIPALQGLCVRWLLEIYGRLLQGAVHAHLLCMGRLRVRLQAPLVIDAQVKTIHGPVCAE